MEKGVGGSHRLLRTPKSVSLSVFEENNSAGPGGQLVHCYAGRICYVGSVPLKSTCTVKFGRCKVRT